MKQYTPSYRCMTLLLCILLSITTIYSLYSHTQFIFPFLLTVLSGASTVIGAIIIFAIREPILDIHLAFVAGLAAAVMCFVSFFDMLLPNLHLSSAASSASSSSIDPHTDMDNSITIDSTTNLH